MLRKTIIIIGIVLFAFGFAEAAEKQCYRLLEQEIYSGPPGKPPTPDNRHPVCKILLKNLNKFCNDEPPNMVCEFKIHPLYKKQLSVPKWKKLDIYKNLDKIEAMIRTPLEISESTAHDKNFQDKVWQDYYGLLKKGLDDGTATLYQAYFDLWNIGKAYEVLQVSDGKCTGKPIILDPLDDPKVAPFEYERGFHSVEYSATVLRQLLTPSMVKIGTMKDVFFFKGKTFGYNWHRNELWIFQLFQKPDGHLSKQGICRFQYIKPDKEDE